ncbi:hypothetical protein PHLGIDRAFT_19813 [Phlebiopsis gigantea 11061_1 CR5-6]|uniref:Uncharacterized protein n=1 Tax=Phlebiopsis gigantea (strain 11061_1 CR5-6) TaxID=745531 RepID=A0A0C3NJH2_PHLG1|nr:hypothetical protein PHLGIDRAFT_19813 [Phlebiopsis gigantea 11061_1 CR5-6]
MSDDISLPGDLQHEPNSTLPYSDNVPDNLRAATSRLQFPPSYAVVGIYRLFTDKRIALPVWQKCKHGLVRGVSVALVWTVVTFKLQRVFVELFLIKSPSVTGLSRDAIFGIPMPFDLPTYATLLFVSTQATAIITFFLSKNLRIARDRAYDQTIVSRGKGPEFWTPYVEEWDNPPRPSKSLMTTFARTIYARIAFKMALAPLHLVPVAGIVISAWLRALGTAQYLHRPLFKAKNMTKEQVSVFVEERKWDYRAFGFTAALLEGLPFVGLIFTVSNRIGAAMWAHDLEKRQHYVAEIKRQTVSTS